LGLEVLEDRLTPSTLNATGTADTPIDPSHAAIAQLNPSTSVTPDVAAATTITASSATAPFSASTQNVTLSATVTSSAGTVNEGSVNFEVLQGTTVLGTATAGNVSNAQASVSYALPGGTAAGTYTIEADYSDSTGNFAASSDTTHTLIVGSATTTTASNATATFSTSDQEGTLSATVTSSAATVNEGSVTFTIIDSQGNPIGTTSAGVSNGAASVNVVLPGGTPAGPYTIEADYSDSAGSFAPSSDNTHTLTINSASTTTTASTVTTSFSQSAQSVTLTASVTSSAGAVNEGIVTFTLVDAQGNTIGAATAGPVSNGQANVNYVLPAGTAPGSYTIEVDYGDLFGSFLASSGQGALGVNTAGTSLALTTVQIVPNLLNDTAQVTLTAQVSTPAGVGGEGVVSFTLAGTSGQGSVVNGAVSVQLTVPLQDAVGDPNVSLAYTDNAASASLAKSSTSAALQLNIWNALLPTDLTVAADGSQQFQAQLAGQSLLGFAYSSSGLLTEIDVGSLSLPVTYTNVSGDALVTIAGMPWQVNFFGPNGQYQGTATVALPGNGSAEWLFIDPTGQVLGATLL
jgi:hypothetical protein